MADQVTPPVEKTPEEIEREMAQTRDSITNKVAALESQVVGTVQTAADTITHTVEAVKSIVTQAPAAVSDTVKQAAEVVSEKMRDTFDITGHVRRHPWAAVGSAALLGCIAGWLFSPRRGDFSALAEASRPVPPTPPYPPRAADERPGVLDEFVGMLGDRAKELARTALESVSSSLKQTIQESAPKLVNEAASRLTGADGAADPTFASHFDARRTGV